MRVAMVANWWYRRGGLGGVMIDEADWLTRRGVDVVPFAAAHPENLPAPSAGLFPPFRETADLGHGLGLGARVATAASVLHNRTAANRFRQFIARFRPDVVHVHGTIRQLSPAILSMATRARIPVVMTLHDYGLICPQGLMFKANDRACGPPNCVRGNSLHAVRYRCVKGSLLGSGVAAVEYAAHRSLGAYRDHVDAFVAPSRFLLEMVGASGAVDRRRLRHLPNGLVVDGAPVELPKEGGHVLYSGRLVQEKGVDVLVEAARHLPHVPVLVAGDGPLRQPLSRGAPANVTFLGQQDQDALAALRSSAVVVAAPSTWYENAPLAVLEAMRAARPVVATEPGGQAELLAHGGGVLVPASDPAALATAITSLWVDRDRAREIGAAGRSSYLASYTAERHVEGLEAIYREVLAAA